MNEPVQHGSEDPAAGIRAGGRRAWDEWLALWRTGLGASTEGQKADPWHLSIALLRAFAGGARDATAAAVLTRMLGAFAGFAAAAGELARVAAWPADLEPAERQRRLAEIGERLAARSVALKGAALGPLLEGGMPANAWWLAAWAIPVPLAGSHGDPAGIQEVSRAWMELGEAWRAHLLLTEGLPAEVGRRFAVRAGERPDAGAAALYHQWLLACEDVYAGLVRTEAYSRAYGRLINAALELQRLARARLGGALAAVGVATRGDFDALLRRQRELERAVAAFLGGAAPPPVQGGGASSRAGPRARPRRGAGGSRGRGETLRHETWDVAELAEPPPGGRRGRTGGRGK